VRLGERRRAARAEHSADRLIPYLAHVAPGVLRTTAGDFVFAYRLEGASFETADPGQLNQWYERLNVLWRSLAGPGVALWTHVLRRRAEPPRQPAVDQDGVNGFAERLERRYLHRLARERLMTNELYLSVVYRPLHEAMSATAARWWPAKDRAPSAEELHDALDACEKLARTIEAALQWYEPEPLVVRLQGGAWRSPLLAFLGHLVDGVPGEGRLPRGPVAAQLATTRLLFGTEAIEYRAAATTRLGAILGIKEYPPATTVGALNGLLSLPFSFVLTQSFAFLGRGASQSLLQRQHHRMANAGDFAASQAAELRTALDGLASGDFAMGEHHFSLQVLTEPDREHGPQASERRIRMLEDRVAVARSILVDTGMTAAREDLALEAAFWAQLPGNFTYRPRVAPIGSRNLAAFSGFHNYPTGRAEDNHWGPALATLATAARSPYHFSLHASDPQAADGGRRRDAGHTLICGPTGSGKSVLIGFLLAALSRRGVTQVVFDKDRGLEILVRALRGAYLPLLDGEPTGLNPLRLPPSPDNLEFLRGWLLVLARGRDGRDPGAREVADLEQALRGTLALDPSHRRLSRFVEFLDRTDPEGLHARLARWCEGGSHGWVFDNVEDHVAPVVAAGGTVGIDVTSFLGNALVRAPTTLYLFHLVRQRLDGRPFVCWLDEFWRLVDDPAFAAFAKDGPKTWRKLNGVMCLATQSLDDVVSSPIARTLIEQTPTKLLFPNPASDGSDYAGALGLSGREIALLTRGLEPSARRFLVRQGHRSVVCELDLAGFDAELSVLSGRPEDRERMARAIARGGSDPSCWLPEFLGDHATATAIDGAPSDPPTVRETL
jgi:type IV secretion system protein VirB4